MTCIECGAAMEQPASGPVECLKCGRVYLPVDDVGWFGGSIVVYAAEDEDNNGG